jgi:uncharacterized protein YndB with AHSA1/START domain
MEDIFHNLIIEAPAHIVLECITSPEGLDNWWTKTSKGKPEPGTAYELYLGSQFKLNGIVTKFIPGKMFELRITAADYEWMNTRIGFLLENIGDATRIEFYHKGWQQKNDQYKITCYNWAMYLRVLKRHLEFGDRIPYEQRLVA